MLLALAGAAEQDHRALKTKNSPRSKSKAISFSSIPRLLLQLSISLFLWSIPSQNQAEYLLLDDLDVGYTFIKGELKHIDAFPGSTHHKLW